MRRRRAAILGAGGLVLLLILAALIWRDDIISTTLDPKEPFQTYEPPPAPDYGQRAAWALLPPNPSGWTSLDGPADIFFVHPTTFNGGHEWNGPIDDRAADRVLQRTMLPNYAGAFQQIGRVFAPRYRQASLYSLLTNRDDARDARSFAYGDVKRAFDLFRARFNRGRPIVVVGVEQGGQLAARLVKEALTQDPSLAGRLAAVYLVDAIVPAADYVAGSPIPACTARRQARCVVGWQSAAVGDDEAAERLLRRAFVWTDAGRLAPLAGRTPLCVNPLTGAANTSAPAKANLGAANASGMEWGARPAFLTEQVSAACEGGLLRVSKPSSPALRLSGAWADRRKVAPYNLFYADLEADAKARILVLMNRTDFPRSAPSIDRSVTVREVPVQRAR